MALAIVLVVALTILMTCVRLRLAGRRHDVPQELQADELQSDWWEQFEREFRDYARTMRLGQEWTGPERRRHPR